MIKPKDRNKEQKKKQTSYQKKIVPKLLLAIAAFLLSIAIGYLFWQPGSGELNLKHAGKQWFGQNTLLTNVYRIFDVGVVDVNSDGNLDIFTANHNHKQYLLLGNGKGKFSDNVASDWGLDQDRDFPGLEYGGKEPNIDEPGLYIYWRARNLIIENKQNSTPVKGTIEFFASAKVKQQKNFQVSVDTSTIDTGAEVSKIEFSTESATGIFDFNPGNVSLPITIQLDDGIPLKNVYIGNRKLNPDSHQFSFYLRDRHGMAWMNYNNTGNLDAFIVRGGLKGRMATIPQEFNDELLVSDSESSYREAITEALIVKQGCPALKTAWVDTNSDRLLDLYTTCYRGAKNDETKYLNQLYQQQPDGTFIEVAERANLAFSEMGIFQWWDADRDGDSDLLWVNDEAFWLYQNNQGTFTPTKIADNPGQVWGNFEDSSQLTLADYDADGDLDIFAALPTGNTLLQNNAGNYQLVEPTQLGLPAKSFVANWVDYDNDGLADLHAMPDGLYHQKPDGNFVFNKMLGIQSPALLEARATWFDSDNNGTRDLVLATRYKDSLWGQLTKKFLPQSTKDSMWQMTMYPNENSKNHWLEIDLVGDAKNPQAIGSQVEITTPDSIQTAIIGQGEGSQFSQGHYRLYFGLGKQTQVDTLKIFWSDGYEQELKQVSGDRILTVQRENTSLKTKS